MVAVKMKFICGPGCRCQGCTNLPVANQEVHSHRVYSDSNESREDSRVMMMSLKMNK